MIEPLTSIFEIIIHEPGNELTWKSYIGICDLNVKHMMSQSEHVNKNQYFHVSGN